VQTVVTDLGRSLPSCILAGIWFLVPLPQWQSVYKGKS